MTLDVTGLRKSYDGFDFGPVDLSVGGETLAVLGPSGSGKSTFLGAIAGTVTPDAGRVSLDGRPLTGRPIEERRAGIVFQDGALFPHLTARQNISFTGTTDERVEELAERFEIRDALDRRPGALSGGERQRVALARTLAADPDCLLLDEPLSSLDAPTARRLRDELHDLFAALDLPVVYVTHDRRAATVLGDRIAVLRDGRVEQVGPPDEILHRPQSPFVARFTGTDNVLPATVPDGDGASVELRIGDATVEARVEEDVPPDVWACVRPVRVGVSLADSATENGTALRGTVSRVLNEGDDRRVLVSISGTDHTLVASVRDGVDGGPLAPETTVRVSIPPAAIHVIPNTNCPDGSDDVLED
ncbi:ABC transporter ATP-binding protein [Haloplanus litoreus]|uniref:Molybdate/tungstate import ATP-binding protein WtpC n=1 Tax=Haloplanus litoreus TaxID=767515 RepID=A0ABD6A0G5_9EURY